MEVITNKAFEMINAHMFEMCKQQIITECDGTIKVIFWHLEYPNDCGTDFVALLNDDGERYIKYNIRMWNE